jgi:hypothetical protein
MRFENFAGLIENDNYCFVTPFLTRKDKLFFVVTSLGTVEDARLEAEQFEAMTGLVALRAPMLHQELSGWVEKLVQFNIAHGGERSVG